LLTAILRGGVGIRALGSANFGGRNYFFIFAAVAAFLLSLASAFQPSARGFTWPCSFCRDSLL